MNTNTNITPEQFDNLDTPDHWDLQIGIEGFSVINETGQEKIHVNYRDDGEHYIQIIEDDEEVFYTWGCDEACLQFVEDHT